MEAADKADTRQTVMVTFLRRYTILKNIYLFIYLFITLFIYFCIS